MSEFVPRANIEAAVDHILGGTPDPQGRDQRERLVDLMQVLERDGYSAGMRSVQQGVIKALDLAHLLGITR
jgi:hypothetical protein